MGSFPLQTDQVKKNPEYCGFNSKYFWFGEKSEVLEEATKFYIVLPRTHHVWQRIHFTLTTQKYVANLKYNTAILFVRFFL